MAPEHQSPPPRPDADPIGDYWTDVQPKSRVRRKKPEVQRSPPPIRAMLEWGLRFSEPGRPSMHTLPGASTQERAQFLQAYLAPEFDQFRPDCIEDLSGAHTRDWVEEGVLVNFTRRLEAQGMTLHIPKALAPMVPDSPRWSILWGLLTTKDFMVDGAAKDLVDHEGSLMHSVYRALWEARFLAREDSTPERLHAFMGSLIRWITDQPLSSSDADALLVAGVRRRIESLSERVDVLLFLLVLAEQNAILNRTFFLFDDLERALTPGRRDHVRQLDEFLAHVDRWVKKLACPIGVLIGLDTSKQTMAALRRCNAKLYKRIETGLDWT